MAKAWQFYNNDAGFNQDLVVDNFLELAAAEIYATYGHIVKINRKALQKYGYNGAVGATERDINSFQDATYLNKTQLFANTIDSISSSSAADTNVSVYIEGMTIDANNNLTFTTQTVQTNASNGQTRAPLLTNLCDVTRVRGVGQGNIWIYENTALTAGKPTDVTKIQGQLVQGENTSLKAATAIASTNYFLLTHLWANLGKSGGTVAAEIKFQQSRTRDGGVLGTNFFTRKDKSITLNGPLDDYYLPFQVIQPNSRIKLTGSTSSGTPGIYAGFDGFFADIVN